MTSLAHTTPTRVRIPRSDARPNSLGAARLRPIVLEELERVARVGLGSLDDAAMFEVDVPIDWLAFHEVASRIEGRLGVEIDEDALARVRTIGDLVACVADATPARR